MITLSYLLSFSSFLHFEFNSPSFDFLSAFPPFRIQVPPSTMASPVFTPLSQPPNARHDRRLDDDFSDAQMKPAPLRLTRKSPASIPRAAQDSPTIIQQDGPPPAVDMAFETPTPAARSRDPHGKSHGSGLLDLSPPSRPAAPNLPSIVSNYEIIDAMSGVDPREIRYSPGPSKLDEPFTPTPSRRQTVLQNPGASQQLFSQGSPFADNMARQMRRSNLSSNEAQKPVPISPATRSSPSAYKPHPPLAFMKIDSPLRGHMETESNDHRLGGRSYMGD